MPRQRLQRLTTALLLGAALAAAGCSGKSAPPPAPVVTVQAAAAARRPIAQIVDTEAELHARHVATIVPKISAPIAHFYVQRGSRVRAGQLLAVLENRDLTAAVEQARGAYEQAKANYARSLRESLPQQIEQARLNLAATRQAAAAQRAVYRSRQKLYRAGALARNLLNQSQVAYIQARNQYQLAQARLQGLEAVGNQAGRQLAQGQLAAAKGQYQAALANLQYSEIRSPIAGVVTDRPLNQGQMANAGQPLMTVMDLRQVIARAYVSPADAALLRIGDPALLRAGNGDPPLPGRVSVVSPALDPNSTTVQVWVQAANPGGRLQPGATVPVSITARTVPDAVVIPAAAILTASDGSTSVMLIGADQIARQTAVKVGIRQGSEAQILSGLRPGQQVVTAGAYGLPDGTRVIVAPGGGE